jgi:O-antigen/teichoic acid export membrane protein
LGILFTNTDILIISWVKNASDVGVYSAVIRIIQLLYLIPMVIQMSTLPIFSRLAKNNPEKFRFVLERVISLIFLISIPLSFGGAILGGEIMGLVFGSAYIVGGLAFSILMLSMSYDYTGAIIGNAIFSYNHQKNLIVSSAIGGISNVLLDLLFIHHWGIVGSAVATLLTQIFVNSYLWHAMQKLNRFHIFGQIKKIIAAGIIMAIATALLSSIGINTIVNIAISGLVYFVTLFLLKESLLGEIKKIMALGNNI